jgi:hypothetical protein
LPHHRGERVLHHSRIKSAGVNCEFGIVLLPVLERESWPIVFAEETAREMASVSSQQPTRRDPAKSIETGFGNEIGAFLVLFFRCGFLLKAFEVGLKFLIERGLILRVWD